VSSDAPRSSGVERAFRPFRKALLVRLTECFSIYRPSTRLFGELRHIALRARSLESVMHLLRGPSSASDFRFLAEDCARHGFLI
jgi:hypothetical protein